MTKKSSLVSEPNIEIAQDEAPINLQLSLPSGQKYLSDLTRFSLPNEEEFCIPPGRWKMTEIMDHLISSYPLVSEYDVFSSNSDRVIINYLREQLRLEGSGWEIVNIMGVGYKLYPSEHFPCVGEYFCDFFLSGKGMNTFVIGDNEIDQTIFYLGTMAVVRNEISVRPVMTYSQRLILLNMQLNDWVIGFGQLESIGIGRSSMRQHVYNINRLLEEFSVDYRIVGIHGYGFRLEDRNGEWKH